jgi:hypothetical protein
MQVQHGMSGCLGVSQRQHFVCAQRLRFCVDWGVVLVAADSTAQVLLCLPMYVLHERSELQLSPGGLAMLFERRYPAIFCQGHLASQLSLFFVYRSHLPCICMRDM